MVHIEILVHSLGMDLGRRTLERMGDSLGIRISNEEFDRSGLKVGQTVLVRIAVPEN